MLDLRVEYVGVGLTNARQEFALTTATNVVSLLQGAPARDTAVLIQQAAANLLALLCATDSQTCHLLVTDNGLTALASMMPDPPPPTGTDPTPQQAQPADASSSSGSGSGSAGATGDGQRAADKAGAVPALSLVAAAEDTTAGATVQSPRRQQVGQFTAFAGTH